MKIFIACLYLNIEDANWKRQIDRRASFFSLAGRIHTAVKFGMNFYSLGLEMHLVTQFLK